jgi:hypothetical protein
MDNRIAACVILICCCLTSAAPALTADDYAGAGRQQLFERTASGLAQARDIFEAGRTDMDCPDCRSDRSVLFLDAVTKTAQLLLDHSDVLSLDGFFGVADQFGVPLAAIAVDESPADGAAQGRKPDLLASEPDPQTVRQALCDAVLPTLSDVVAELDAISDEPEAFLMYLTPEETGLAGDLEIDYGDVLTLKALLLAYRALLAGQLALQLDAEAGALVVDCHSIALSEATDAHAPGAPDVGLPEGPALGALDRDVWPLERARQDWHEAVQRYLEAVDYVAGEDNPRGTDPQEDEFVYIDLDTGYWLDRFRQTLMAFGESFFDAGSSGPAPETYDVYDRQGVRIGQLTLVSSHRHLEGTSGRMILADGSALEVEWFGTVDEGQVGVSLYAPDRGLEGWFEGAIEGGRSAIRDGVLDLWAMIDSEADGEALSDGRNALVYLDTTLAWSKLAWAQLREVLTPVSGDHAATP